MGFPSPVSQAGQVQGSCKARSSSVTPVQKARVSCRGGTFDPTVSSPSLFKESVADVGSLVTVSHHLLSDQQVGRKPHCWQVIGEYISWV